MRTRSSSLRWPSSLALALAFVSAPLMSGCAHETVAARQLASLEDGLNRDTAERDREDPRLDPVRIQAEEQSKLAPVRSSAPPPLPFPHTVDVTAAADARLAAQAAESEDTDETSPRPVIRVVGSGIVRRHGGGRDDRIEETLPDETPDAPRVGPPIQNSAPPSSALDPNAKRAYDAALALVNGHEYDHALEAFAAFLVKWPDHPNADNAMYWRGEAYFAKGELARAAEEFDGAIRRFPLGNKVPDCLLKLGICQQKLGNRAKAQTFFDRLSRDYPRSEAARRIPTDRTAAGRAGPEENP